ncbi:OLC1v1028812C1 [Oldenlandia corymbosa var. corymbosa]|uniref:OLC1v1028812C1 n=1 Tax=Oldenlandia corymbosa var. corymbosa TaxID=529605 RepID=A0AAV1CD20_OLDCO|nr:OLC1v1028812C1 [Oldenlandia corymbosa var. corymbosa]
MSAKESLVVDDPGDSYIDLEKQQPNLEDTNCSHSPPNNDVDDAGNNSLQSIVISDDHNHDVSAPKSSAPVEVGQQCPQVASQSPKKPAADLSRSSSSSRDECRVCQQEKDEALMELGCHCRGGLSKAHQSCITTWFGTRGSNKCEICQQAAANITLPESQASYWVWRLDPAYGGRGMIPRRDRVSVRKLDSFFKTFNTWTCLYM